jgi:D-alanine transaminase
VKSLGYYNGKFGPIEEMMIPMNDRVSYFGDGVYDATYSANGVIYTLDEHMDRFFNSAGLLKINIPLSKDEMKGILYEMLAKVDSDENFIYWQTTRGTGMRSHAFLSNDMPANIWIVIKPDKVKDLSQKIRLITAEDTRFYHCNIKTLNLLVNVMASQKATEMGCNECVFHRGDGVTECAHSNIHIIKDGVFKTAPTDHLILPGIARAHLIKMCKKHNIPVDEAPFTVEELFNADEILISSAGSFCLAACEIDGIPCGGKAPEILKTLQDGLTEEFETETKKSLIQ